MNRGSIIKVLLILAGVAVGRMSYFPGRSRDQLFKGDSAGPVLNQSDASVFPSYATDPSKAGDNVAKVLLAKSRLDRMRNFVPWLGKTDSENWKDRWESFAQAIAGKEGRYEGELQLFLKHLGEVAGAEALAYFAAQEASGSLFSKTQSVLSSWAGKDPEAAAESLSRLPPGMDGDKLLPALIQGTASHSPASLIKLTLDPRYRGTDLAGSWAPELIAALRQWGEIGDGEALWRQHQEKSFQRGPDRKFISSSILFEALVKWKCEAASPAHAGEVCQWLSGILAEGYEDSRWWTNAMTAARTYAQSDPAAAFDWVRDFSVKAGARTAQEHSMANQIGLTPAKEWAKQDPVSLSQWLAAHPGDYGYEAGAAALYDALKDSDPESAMAWGNNVKFGWLRRAVGLAP